MPLCVKWAAWQGGGVAGRVGLKLSKRLWQLAGCCPTGVLGTADRLHIASVVCVCFMPLITCDRAYLFSAHHQIGGFMSEIADEFKIVVVEAIKALCLKFPQVFTGAWSAGSRQQLHRTRAAAALAEPAAPASRRQCLCACLLLTSRCLHPLFLQKYRGLMNFLSNILREDGGFEYKKASGWVVMACFGLGREGGGVGGERRGGMWVGEA